MIRRIWEDRISHWDAIVFRMIFDRNGRALWDRFFFMITRSADGYIYAFIAGIFLMIDHRTGWKFLSAALIGYGIKIPAYMLIKRLIKRKRPFDNIQGIRFLIPPPDQFSFPSGHTAGAFLFAILLSHFVPTLSLFLILWASLVGISRIYVGVHYPTDVLAGAVLGAASAKIGLLIV